MNKGIRLFLGGAACAAISFTTFAAAKSLAGADPASAPIVRELPWPGGESLTVEVPANVRFVQTPGPAKVVVTGPNRSVKDFAVDGGVLSDKRWRTGKPVDVVVYAPKITHFSLKGGDKLIVENFDQPDLTIEATGRAEVKASGRAGLVRLRLQGFGWADLSALSAAEADVNVSGGRHAIVAARDRARVSGNGSVVFVGKPAELQLSLGDSGRVFTLGDALASNSH
jgi:hypothetical protein